MEYEGDVEVEVEGMNIPGVENLSPMPLGGGAHAVGRLEVGAWQVEDARAQVMEKVDEAVKHPGCRAGMNTGKICSHPVTGIRGVGGFESGSSPHQQSH